MSEKTKAKANMSKAKQNMTEKTKMKMKKAQENQKPITCPHCGKTGRIGPKKQWHFDKCKYIK